MFPSGFITFLVRAAWKATIEFVRGWVFGGITGVVFILTAGYNYVTLGPEKVKLTLVQSVLFGVLLLSAVFIVRYIYEFFVLFFKERDLLAFNNPYGDAILKLNEAFAVIHAARRDGSSTDQKLVDSLTQICEQLRDIFKEKTGKECSVCIKVGKDGSNLRPETIVKTLARSALSKGDEDRKRVDDVKYRHQILKNTAFHNFFARLGRPESQSWICTDLPMEKGYNSTSFDVFGYPDKKDTTSKRKHENWPLLYQSEIVVPICPLNHPQEDEKTLLYGFLCLDSPSVGKFNPTYDVGIMKGVADGIFDILDRYRASLQPKPISEAHEQ